MVFSIVHLDCELVVHDIGIHTAQLLVRNTMQITPRHLRTHFPYSLYTQLQHIHHVYQQSTAIRHLMHRGRSMSHRVLSQAKYLYLMMKLVHIYLSLMTMDT